MMQGLWNIIEDTNKHVIVDKFASYTTAWTKWPLFADENFKNNFLNLYVHDFVQITLNFVVNGLSGGIHALVQGMAWHPNSRQAIT